MLMLYAKTIESANWDYRKSFERLTVKKENITDVNFEERASDEQNGIISVKEGRFGYFIRLKENKNFSTVVGFFEYIRDYSEIAFETKEIPTKREIKVGDVYQNGDTFILILGVDNLDVSAIRYEFDDIVDYSQQINKNFILREWEYIGNNETAAYNIAAGFNDFRYLIKEKEN